MHTLRNVRTVFRAGVLRRCAPHATLPPTSIYSLRSPILRSANAFQQHRAVASHVSGRPASQTISQAAVNVREEVGNSTTDWAKVIAGGNFTDDAVKPDSETFVSGILGMK